jgi:hypothetical protein
VRPWAIHVDNVLQFTKFPLPDAEAGGIGLCLLLVKTAKKDDRRGPERQRQQSDGSVGRISVSCTRTSVFENCNGAKSPGLRGVSPTAWLRRPSMQVHEEPFTSWPRGFRPRAVDTRPHATALFPKNSTTTRSSSTTRLMSATVWPADGLPVKEVSGRHEKPLFHAGSHSQESGGFERAIDIVSARELRMRAAGRSPVQGVGEDRLDRPVAAVSASR